MWTDRPEHDSAMRDIESAQMAGPDCAICGEPIYPGDYFFRWGNDYFHEDCIKTREYEDGK